MSSALNNMTIAGPRTKGLQGERGLYLLWQLDQDLRALQLVRPNTVILEGEASGIDSAARDMGRQHGFRINPHPVLKEEWLKSRGAGYARNQVMVDKSENVRTYWNGESKGTRHTTNISFTVNKLERLVLWNGIIWERGVSRWHPLKAGDKMNIEYEYQLSIALQERLKRNKDSQAMREGGVVNIEKLSYANARARDAFAWLSDWHINTPVIVQVPETEAEAQFVGWYRFKSKGRANKFHYTAPGASECTCEGWHPELVGKAASSRKVCRHMMIVWEFEYVQNVILPEQHPLVSEEELREQEKEYRYAFNTPGSRKPFGR